MIKYLLLILGLIPINSNGQTPFISEIELVGGPSLSSYWGKHRPKDQVVNLTYFFGGGVSHKFKNKLEINVKLLYERKGNKMDYTETLYDENDVPGDYRFIQGSKLDYLTLLPNVKYYIDNSETFYAGLGGYISNLRKSATYTEMQSLDTGATTYYYAYDEIYDDFDFGVSFMTGYRIQLRPKLILNTQLITGIGLQDIVKDDGPMDGSLKCFNLSIGVGLIFKP
jgi:hypothetical protein